MSQQTQDTSHQDQNRPMLAETMSAQQEQRASGQALPILPGDPDYEAARRVWNGAYDLHPALIVRWADVEDVREAVTFAREQAMTLSVRSGGHNMAGYGTNEGGMVIDLCGMKAIAIDPQRRTARLEPGLTWGEVAHALQPYGLALTAGDTASMVNRVANSLDKLGIGEGDRIGQGRR